jgi:hypothetical protein
MEICPRCQSELSGVEDKCPTCGYYVGPPNVRAANIKEERKALDLRYQSAIAQSKVDGREHALASFEEAMRKTSAVVNVDLQFLHQFLTNDKSMYSNYELSVKGQMRKPAISQDDRNRTTVGSMLFGSYANEIRYAALSLDGAGLKSYGAFAIKLRDVAIEDRATLLEDNSYIFISNQDVRPLQGIPPGYRATWGERHKLAVAKLSMRIFAGTTEPEHSRILMSGTGNRQTDEFIEVYIYGPFDSKAIEAVRGSTPAKGGSSAKVRLERACLSTIKDYLSKAGKTWIEE